MSITDLRTVSFKFFYVLYFCMSADSIEKGVDEPRNLMKGFTLVWRMCKLS